MFQITHEKGSEVTLFRQSRRKTSERVWPLSNQSRPEATDRNVGEQAAPWQLQRWPVDRLCPPHPTSMLCPFPYSFLPSLLSLACWTSRRSRDKPQSDGSPSIPGWQTGERCGGKLWRRRGGTATASKRFAMKKSWQNRLCDNTLTAVNRLKFVIKEPWKHDSKSYSTTYSALQNRQLVQCAA